MVGIFSRRFLRQMTMAHVRLVRLTLKGLAWNSPIGVVYRKDGYLPPQAHRLIELLKANVASKAGGG